MRSTGAVDFHPSSAVDFTAATAVDNSRGRVEPCDCGVCCPERVDADGWPLTPAGERERPVTVRRHDSLHLTAGETIPLQSSAVLCGPQQQGLSSLVVALSCCPHLAHRACLRERRPSEACVVCAWCRGGGTQETPLVRRHPVTGELAVHGSVQGFWRFVGRDEEESRDIMQVRHRR